MTDGIIKGTGNSRYLRVPADAKTKYGTWDAALDAMIAGTFQFDLNGVNPAGWDVQGDKLNKATLLTDTLCSALGLATTATPTEAMEKLRQLLNALSLKFQSGSFVPPYSNSEVNLVFQTVPIFIFIWYDLIATGNPAYSYPDLYLGPAAGHLIKLRQTSGNDPSITNSMRAVVCSITGTTLRIASGSKWQENKTYQYLAICQ